MPLMVEDTGGGMDFTPVPQGTHLAVCDMVVDLGQQETTYMGEKKIVHQVFIRWELPHERLEYEKDGQRYNLPMIISKTYTASLSEKANLRKDLEAWRGRAFTEEELKGFDVFNILGACCQVTVTHKDSNGKTYANVASVAGWPKGMERITAENPLLKYSADETGDFDKLPEWLQTRITSQIIDDQVPTHHDQAPPPLDDDIPF